MKVTDRRKELIALLSAATEPLSGSALAARFQVSRQIIVQDITVLKGQGFDILSTHYGYVLQKSPHAERVFKVKHSSKETKDELCTIVDAGATVVDVFVWHKVYGKISADLNIFSQHGIAQFLQGIQSGRSTELMHITDGYHYHTVRADNEHTLDAIEGELRGRGYIVPEP